MMLFEIKKKTITTNQELGVVLHTCGPNQELDLRIAWATQRSLISNKHNNSSNNNTLFPSFLSATRTVFLEFLVFSKEGKNLSSTRNLWQVLLAFKLVE